MSKKIYQENSVIVVNSDKLPNELICNFINSLGHSVVGSVQNSNDGMKLAIEYCPSLAIVQLELTNISGLDVAGRIAAESPKTKVIVYSKMRSQVLIEILRQQKVRGLICLDDSLIELSDCIDAVLAGKTYFNFTPEIKFDDEKENDKRFIKASNNADLTKAELKVFWLLSRHLSTKEIASKLALSPYTVNNHLSNLRRKLKQKGNGTLFKYSQTPDGKLLVQPYGKEPD